MECHRTDTIKTVFGNALCNISALSGRSDGLFYARTPDTISYDNTILSDGNLHHSYMMNDLDLWNAELVHTPLRERAWVLQEEVLAKRTIYFGDRQVLWDCTQFRACETYPLLPSTMAQPMQEKTSLEMPHMLEAKRRLLHDNELEGIASAISVARLRPPDPNKFGPSYQGDLPDLWRRFIAHYSMRELTFPTDKLLAISGVARLLSRAMQDRFVAGLWESYLAEGLLWYIRPTTLVNRPTEYRAPSWSWASCEGYVLHAEPFQFSWTVAQAFKPCCVTATGDEFGTVVSAHTSLQAYCLQLHVSKDGVWTASRNSHKISLMTVRLDTTEDVATLERIYGAIIRTTAYRLTDKVTLPWPSKTPPQPDKKGKILLAAQGIILTPSTTGTSTNATQPPPKIGPLDKNAHQDLSKTRLRRIGYFALEDRKSGRLTPKWVVPGLKIFHDLAASPIPRERALADFPFLEQQELMATLQIV